MENKHIIGIDVGGSKVAYGLFDSHNKIIYRIQHETDADADGHSFSDTLIENVNSILSKNNLTFEQLEGIGVGMPSFIEYDSGYIFMTSAMPKIKDFAMREYLNQHLPTRIVFDNDANVAALAEHRHGAGRGTRHMIYVVIGTGFGGGIIINGNVFRGSYGAAGEFGHALATPHEGLMCGCENSGCFMSHIAGKHLPLRVNVELKSGIQSVLNPATVDGQQLLSAYKQDDALACQVIDKMAHYIAVSVYNLYQTLNIDTYVFGGGLSNLGDTLLGRVREEFDKFNHITFPVHFKMAELKGDIGIIGAAECMRESA